MKALSVRQPHADRIASGIKTIELRTWSTRYRGPLLICASKRNVDPGATDAMPRGVAVCIVELLDVRPATNADRVAACVSREIVPGDFAWVLRVKSHPTPFPVAGRLGLFEVPVLFPNGAP